MVSYRVKSEREKQRSYINTYMWNLEEWFRWPYLQEEIEKQMERTNIWIPREKGEWREELEDWD